MPKYLNISKKIWILMAVFARRLMPSEAMRIPKLDIEDTIRQTLRDAIGISPASAALARVFFRLMRKIDVVSYKGFPEVPPELANSHLNRVTQLSFFIGNYVCGINGRVEATLISGNFLEFIGGIGGIVPIENSGMGIYLKSDNENSLFSRKLPNYYVETHELKDFPLAKWDSGLTLCEKEGKEVVILTYKQGNLVRPVMMLFQEIALVCPDLSFVEIKFAPIERIVNKATNRHAQH